MPPSAFSASSAKDASSSPKPPKRSAKVTAGIQGRTRKRARLTVREDETTQVTSLEDRYRLPLADADAYYVPYFVDEATAQEWHDELLKLNEWYRPTLKVYGKEVTQSRKIAGASSRYALALQDPAHLVCSLLAFSADPELEVKYSGHPVDMHLEYPPLLRKIQDMVETKLGVKFNHAFLNLYEDGKIYIGSHRDNRENRVIASLSLGASRTFVLTHDAPSSSYAPPATADEAASSTSAPTLLYSHRFTLAPGSLVIMQGATQQRWKHAIPKEPEVKDSRISITFRQLVF
ncbi:alpha-ketoglutarate-dependent dioxygenase alkB-like protein [Rhodotorula toruloides]|uniref:Alpha-ketoglutarate-dependent dioxygenase alkB-like protein n=1 Tax=Rhodotorula toruloides TaxID=5286 RepID=A0A511KPH8_RHOTO|nr:alpha-ketoglutarate-dependent dioxygenase alkB-like protein [Rhodotorula toruloides]